MASNNRKAPPRWPPKNADDRNRHGASRAPQAGGSLHAKRRIDNKKVQETLHDMFVNVFDSEIIRSVAHSCGWKLNKSIEALIMLAEGSEFPDTKLADNFGSCSSSTFQSYLVSNSVPNETASSSKSRFSKDSNKTDKSMVNDVRNESLFACTPLNKSAKASKSKSVMMNASQGTIKVMYKGQDGVDVSDDDDADVVIEEENEFDINDPDLAFADVSTQSMYQFVTPFISTSHSLNERVQYSRACASRQNIPLPTANKLLMKHKQTPNLPQSIPPVSPAKTPAKKPKHWPKLERIKKQIIDGIKVMVLMRGCPGSGKTSLARHIIKSTFGENEQKYIFSTDHYFIHIGNGKYTFEPRLLPNAHKWNQQQVSEAVKKEISPIIIDNTNLEAWEMEPYIKVAVEFGYNLEFLEPRTSWRNNSFELERKNTHGVPRRKIEDMLERFEHDLTPAKVLSAFKLKYATHNLPPQYITQKKPVARGEDDSLTHGTKKKLKAWKKSDGKLYNSVVETTSHHSKNEVSQQIQFPDDLGSDVTDKEIRESIGMLLSELQRSVVSTSSETEKSIAPQKEIVGQYDKEFCSQRVHGVSGERGAGVIDGSENLSRAVGEDDEPVNQDLDVFEELDGEMAGGDEMDFMTDSSENSEEVESASATDGESGEDVGLPYSDVTISGTCNNAIDTNSFEEGKNIKGMEYVLVLSDGTLLPQKSYHKNDYNSCASKENGRVWEYLLMTDDDSKLLLHATENSTLQDLGTEVFHDSLQCDTPVLTSSKEVLVQPEKDITTASNSFMQKIAAEEPPLEYLLFPDVGDILHSDDVLESVEHDDAQSEPTKSSHKGLDLLVAEGAASLNIAFAGVDDVLSLQSSVPQKLDVGNDFSDILTVETDTTVGNSLQNSSVISKLTVEVEEALFNSASRTQNKEICQDIELSSTLDIFSCDETYEAMNKKFIKSSASSGIPEFESQVTDSVQDEVVTDTEAQRNTGTDLLSFKNDLVDSVIKLFSSNASKNKMNEKDLLEEWAGGTSWDEKETTSANVNSHPISCTPKPARNCKRQASLELSPLKKNEEENKVYDTIASESWCAVEEPVATWEVESESFEQIENKPPHGVEPQPQRKMFAAVLEEVEDDLEKNVAVEELKSSGDNECRVPFETDSTASKPISDNDNLLDLTNNAECDQVAITEQATVDSVQKELTAPFLNLISTTHDLFGASCSNSSIVLEPQKHVTDSSTNTHHADFIILSNVNMGSEGEVSGMKILPTLGRNIVENDLVMGKKQNVRKVGQILTLDKSSMTYDIISSIPETENMKEQLEELVNMFPHFRVEDLQEIFEKCNMDINWTVDLLLESVTQGIEISTPNSTSGVEPETGILVEINSSLTNIELLDNVQSPLFGTGAYDSPVVSSTMPSSCSQVTPVNQETTVKSSLASKRNGKKDRTPVSETSLLLKKQLEENIIINDEHYSEHVSRIRKMRHGEVTDLTEISGNIEEGDESSNVNILPQSLLDVGPDELLLQQTSDPHLAANFGLRHEAPEWDLSEMEVKDTADEEEETIALKMDPGFAEQLHNLFGTASLPFNEDSKPMLNLPLSLARQLHYYMMEAEQNTYDLMMQEDEELARKLQVQEDRVSAEAIVSSVKQVPDLREIMDMEMALALYKTDQKQSNPESKEDLATKLTKNLLCEWFPSLPKDVLINVFEAHNHSFEETLEVLLASTGEDNSVRTVMTPEARAAYEAALLQKANLEGEKNKENLRPYSMESEEVTQEQALQDANYYRSEASRHYSLRNECQNKAQKAYQRGLTAAASYYSQMASLHKERIEENNSRAASSLLLAHSLGNLNTTLDLHFLYVVEALQVLDMFLDHHIHQLLDSSCRSVPVFVITGRGARSSGGRSRIKPAVVQRLEQRGLRHEEVNPGLLKVVITRNATSSTRISS